MDLFCVSDEHKSLIFVTDTSVSIFRVFGVFRGYLSNYPDLFPPVLPECVSQHLALLAPVGRALSQAFHPYGVTAHLAGLSFAAIYLEGLLKIARAA